MCPNGVFFHGRVEKGVGSRSSFPSVLVLVRVLPPPHFFEGAFYLRFRAFVPTIQGLCAYDSGPSTYDRRSRRFRLKTTISSENDDFVKKLHFQPLGAPGPSLLSANAGCIVFLMP